MFLYNNIYRCVAHLIKNCKCPDLFFLLSSWSWHQKKLAIRQTKCREAKVVDFRRKVSRHAAKRGEVKADAWHKPERVIRQRLTLFKDAAPFRARARDRERLHAREHVLHSPHNLSLNARNVRLLARKDVQRRMQKRY